MCALRAVKWPQHRVDAANGQGGNATMKQTDVWPHFYAVEEFSPQRRYQFFLGART